MSGADSAYADNQMQARVRMMNANIGQQSHPVNATPQTMRPVMPAEAAVGTSNSLSNRNVSNFMASLFY